MTSAFSAFGLSGKSIEAILNVESILGSIKKSTDFIDKFRRDNEQLGAWFENDIRGYLGQRGWFVAGSLSARQYQSLKKAIKQDKETEIEDFMVQHVRSITDNTASAAYVKWPHRRAILSDAFDAHSKKLYTLSVPVILAQADGMAFELLNAFLFTNHSGKIGDKAEAMIEKECKQRPLAQSWLGLLTEASGLQVSTKTRDEQIDTGMPVSPLNRHGVLHGIDYDYPKECNSLRAIALVYFLNWVHEITSKQNVS